MRSFLTDDFREHYRRLPQDVKRSARKNYRLWKANPSHPSLQFKQIHAAEALYSVRVGRGWRALGYEKGMLFTGFGLVHMLIMTS